MTALILTVVLMGFALGYSTVVRTNLEQTSFNRRALKDLQSGRLDETGLGTYLDELNCSAYFREHYLFPLAGAIWSSPDEDINAFPAATFINFFRNHGMLELSKLPRWQTVVGGSHAYVKAFRNIFNGEILTGDAVAGIG